jgi:thiol-disulfide isomerase/thioredoxin
VRAGAYVFLLACCLGLPGCSLFGKKGATKPTDPPKPGGDSGWPAAPAEMPAAPVLQPTGATVGSGVLAGQVRDTFDRVPPPTSIQVVPAQEAGGAKGAPIEVAADAQGYFTILDLKAGQTYLLIARTREGQPRLVGQVLARAPNPRILIQMSSDLATPNIPPAPGAPTLPGQKTSPATSIPQGGGWPSSAADSGSPVDPARPSSVYGPRSIELGPPLRVGEPPAQPQSNAVRPESIAADPNGLARRDIDVNIPSQAGALRGSRDPASSVPTTPTRVPSCVLTGKQLYNFALYDLDGQPWEYRNHRGRLVLLDFWGTWCLPCQQAIPHLRILQQEYGPYGLEVIGIDYERDGTHRDQARRVQNVRDRLNINYQLLLGDDPRTCPVKTQFGVRQLPTLVLLDENNQIIWSEVGFDTEKLQDLTLLIKRRLRAQ